MLLGLMNLVNAYCFVCAYGFLALYTTVKHLHNSGFIILVVLSVTGWNVNCAIESIHWLHPFFH